MFGYDAVVLTGGSGRRMDDPDKTSRTVGGRRLVDLVLTACTGAGQLVVVGPETPLERSVVWTREQPPGGGPVAALRAGLAAVRADQVALLAGDLPFLTSYDIDLLRRLAVPPAAGAVLVDDAGREQWLAGVWRSQPLREALTEYEGSSMRGLLGPLRPRPLAVHTSTRPSPWLDCDTPEQLTHAERLAAGRDR